MLRNPILDQVNFLVANKKFEQAESLIKQQLSQFPDDPDLLMLLADVMQRMEKFDQADQVIDNAIRLAPYDPMGYYIKAIIAFQQTDLKKAEEQLEQAISISPNEPDYYMLMARIFLLRKNYEQALLFSDRALELDPQDLDALNTRSLVLIKLERKEESFETNEGALAEDPNNAYTHASYGWNLLEAGDHKKALIHFEQSLKINPNLEISKEGMKESIKAGNFVYNWFLKYQFWMAKLSAKYQWGFVIGIWLLMKLVTEFAAKNEALTPFVYPFIFGVAAIVLLTWLIVPISNVFLRFHKYGEYLLKKFEKKNANLVAAMLLHSAVFFVVFFTISYLIFFYLGIFALLLSIPASTYFHDYEKPWIVKTLLFVMIFFAFIASFLVVSTGEFYNLFTILFFVGLYGYQIMQNYLTIKESNPE